MSRLNATDRLRRLLSVIPWVSGRGEVELTEIAERFDYPLDTLRRDLTEVVQFVGVYPHTPDMLIEVYLDEENERVRFELADYFRSPLQLSPEEGLSLVSAGLGLLGSSAGQDNPLERALTKIADRFGVAIGEELQVSLGAAGSEVVSAVRTAEQHHELLEIDYHSLHRGAATTREIEPLAVFSQEGEWYVRAWCRLADAERTFRLDRILALRALGVTFEPRQGSGATTFAPSEDDMRVHLRLRPEALWVADAYPVESVTPSRGRSVNVTLVASSVVWLERLLLQLGDAAELVATEPELEADLRARTARRVLARYS